MAYKCNSCSYQANARFPGGRCPACDSFDVVTTQTQPPTPSKKKKTAFEIFLLVVFWSALIYKVWSDYLQDYLQG